MTKFSRFSVKSTSIQKVGRSRVFQYGGVVLAALMLAGCAIEVENRQAVQEVARLAKPPGSVYVGWRVFQDRCARCHGPDATGTGIAPDLLPKVQDMGARRFVGLVLKRYDWNSSATQVGGDSVALDALIEDIMQRKGSVISMPEWQGEPRVNAHLVDLYAYLMARADGTQGAGRPAP